MKKNKKQEENTENLPEIPPNHLAYAVLRSQGFNNQDASKMLKMTPSNGSRIDQKINKKYDLTSLGNVKLAVKAHRKILNLFLNPNKVKNDSGIEIKGADISKAIDRSVDRHQPIKRSEDHSSISFIQINLDSYK